jgi:hypothetical protein
MPERFFNQDAAQWQLERIKCDLFMAWSVGADADNIGWTGGKHLAVIIERTQARKFLLEHLTDFWAQVGHGNQFKIVRRGKRIQAEAAAKTATNHAGCQFLHTVHLEKILRRAQVIDASRASSLALMACTALMACSRPFSMKT